jgi:hypothetical protein
MTIDPDSLDGIVIDSRSRLERVRKLFPNPADFDHYAKRAVRMALEEKGFTEKTIQFTLRATFGEGAH